MYRLLPSALAIALGLLVVPLGLPGQAAPQFGHVTVVQAVPGTAVDVSIDGRSVVSGARVGDLLGPFDLAPGEHDIVFSNANSLSVVSTLDVAAGASTDVVLHLPAQVDGEPVVHSYSAPTGAIGPNKARVVLAHTATVAPADVEVDGEIVFTNIANGEFATADVPAGTHRAALLPAGSTDNPILGPLDLALEASTLSMIYAYGNPRDGSMNVIAHTTSLQTDGSVTPTRIDTGSSGLVHAPVDSFAARVTSAEWLAWLAVLAAGAAPVLVAAHRRSRPEPASPKT